MAIPSYQEILDSYDHECEHCYAVGHGEGWTFTTVSQVGFDDPNAAIYHYCSDYCMRRHRGKTN